MTYSPTFVKAAHVITAKKDDSSTISCKKIIVSGYKGTNLVTMTVSVKDFTEQEFLKAFIEFHECIRKGLPNETWTMEVIDKYYEYNFILPEDISTKFNINGVKVR